MLSPNVSSFICSARLDSNLTSRVKSADEYQHLAVLSEEAAHPASTGQLRAAFAARSAIDAADVV